MSLKLLKKLIRFKLKALAPFLTVKRYFRAKSPSPKPIHFPNTSSQNSETVILFSLVERSNNKDSRDIVYVSTPQLCNLPIML